MSRFEGHICPVCMKRFTGTDDIAVCPECGTPHHRECYLKNGKCAMEEIHADYEWRGNLPQGLMNDAETEEQPEPEANYDTIFEEKRDPIYLSPIKSYREKNEFNFDRASRDKTESPEPPIDSEVQSELRKIFEINFLYDGEDMPQSNTVMQDMLSSRKEGRDGVSMLELTFFTGVSLAHYVVPFVKFMKTGQKNGFNLSSGLLMGIHQFFRKMDIWGILMILLDAAFELIPRILYEFGVLPDSALGGVLIGARLLSFLPVFLMCLFGDKLYYNHAVRHIHKIRRKFQGKTDTVEYYLAIREAGGVSVVRAIFGLLVLIFSFVLAHYLPSLLV